MDEQYIYLMFSSTPYRIGKLIRKVLRSTYNHTSIALDKELTQIYGFARRYYRTPFFGGFVRESLSRYELNGVRSQIKLCKIPVTAEQYQTICHYIQTLERNKAHYLYNHLSILTTPIRKSFPVKDAFVCVEFCAQILHMAGVDIDPKGYISIPQLEKKMDAYTVYAGPIPQPEQYDADFYQKRPVRFPLLRSAGSIAALIPRIGK